MVKSKLPPWSGWTLWGFAWEDSGLVVLDKWWSYRGGCLNRFDCIWTFSLDYFLVLSKVVSPSSYAMASCSLFILNLLYNCFKKAFWARTEKVKIKKKLWNTLKKRSYSVSFWVTHTLSIFSIFFYFFPFLSSLPLYF